MRYSLNIHLAPSLEPRALECRSAVMVNCVQNAYVIVSMFERHPMARRIPCRQSSDACRSSNVQASGVDKPACQAPVSILSGQVKLHRSLNVEEAADQSSTGTVQLLASKESRYFLHHSSSAYPDSTTDLNASESEAVAVV